MTKIVYLQDVFYPRSEDWQKLGLLERTLKIKSVELPGSVIYDVKVNVKNQSGVTIAKLPIGSNSSSPSIICINNSSILSPFENELLTVELDGMTTTAIVSHNTPYVSTRKNHAYSNVELNTAFGVVELSKVPVQQWEGVSDVLCLPFDLVASLGFVNVRNLEY